MTGTTRRGLLGGSAAMAVACPALEVGGRPPDADLLAACVAFDELERAYIAAGSTHTDGTPEADAASAEQTRIAALQDALAARMCDLRAVTQEGHVARASLMQAFDLILHSHGDNRGDAGLAVLRVMRESGATC